jgi:hypothetical protein
MLDWRADFSTMGMSADMDLGGGGCHRLVDASVLGAMVELSGVLHDEGAGHPAPGFAENVSAGDFGTDVAGSEEGLGVEGGVEFHPVGAVMLIGGGE